MNKLSIVFVIAIFLAVQVNGQSIFSNVALVKGHDRNIISFTLAKEINVAHYRVEAGNGSDEFDIIGTVPSTGNSVLVKAYSYDLAGLEYKYYRVGKVGMNGRLEYSSAIRISEAQAEEQTEEQAKEKNAPLAIKVLKYSGKF